MNAVAKEITRAPSPALAADNPFGLLRAVVENNAPLETIEKFMELQRRWEADQARKAFSTAMAVFREQHIRVVRSAMVKQGPLNGTAYAKLSDFVGATASPLAAAGLSTSWRITKDEKDWIEVACIVRHADGHCEETRMGGPPDTGGAKNMIQARASTVSYLEKYTLKMALGLAEQDDDDDGNGGPENAGQQRHAAQTRTETKAGAEQKPEKPPYSAEAFDANLPQWKELVNKGDKTPAEIIARLRIRATLTDAQCKEIHALSNPTQQEEHAHA